MAGLLSILCKPSLTRSRGSAPIEPIVQAGLDGVLVIAEADGGNNTSGAGEESVPGAVRAELKPLSLVATRTLRSISEG